MKNRLASIFLLFAILLNILSFTACGSRDKTGEDDGKEDDNTVKDEYFFCDCVPSSELSREKLEGALTAALSKIDQGIVYFDGISRESTVRIMSIQRPRTFRDGATASGRVFSGTLTSLRAI